MASEVLESSSAEVRLEYCRLESFVSALETIFMTRKKKILCAIPLVLVLFGGAAYFIGSHLLDSYSRQYIDVLARRGRRHGISIVSPYYSQAKIAGIGSARWSDLYVELQFPRSKAFNPDRVFELRVDQVDAWLEGEGQVTIRASNIALDTKPPVAGAVEQLSDSRTLDERFSAGRVQFSFPLELSNPLPGVEDALSKMVSLMVQGSTSMVVSAKGVLEFSLNGSPVKVGLEVKEVDAEYALVLVHSDLQSVSELFSEPLTEAEIELLASYPLRAAQLLSIKEDAETTARKAKQLDDSVPEDAYRHVLWSYLLTREFGKRFAQRVTDSHEEGDTGNTAEEKQMDLNNNKVGRRLAGEEFKWGQILSHVKTDPRVVREPAGVVR